jgi:hypothetical protein
MNPFSNILSSEFKQLFNDAIDAVLSDSGLTNECILLYGNEYSEQNFCDNCILDTISRVSSNIYNGTGPKPFPDNTVCPVCLGMGMSKSTKQETVKLAVIIDSKSFISVGDIAMIGSGVIQTICSIDLLPKISNAQTLVVKGIEYQRIEKPQSCGLSDHRYIITLWKNK